MFCNLRRHLYSNLSTFFFAFSKMVNHDIITLFAFSFFQFTQTRVSASTFGAQRACLLRFVAVVVARTDRLIVGDKTSLAERTLVVETWRVFVLLNWYPLTSDDVDTHHKQCDGKVFHDIFFLLYCT